jgi:hypothetical protein
LVPQYGYLNLLNFVVVGVADAAVIVYYYYYSYYYYYYYYGAFNSSFLPVIQREL